MRVDLILPPLWSFLGQQPAHEQRFLTVGNKDSDRCHGIAIESEHGTQELEDICKGFADTEYFLFQLLSVLLKLVDVVETLTKLDSLFRRDSTVYSGLNLRHRKR